MINNALLHSLIDGLNEPQRLAVTHSYDKNTLVVAGAGSGKTGVLTRRIAFIVASGHSTDSILAVTFTNKAADEMRKRVGQYIGVDNAKKILMGTFHSVCVEILRKFGREIGVPRYFTIYDSNDSKQIMKEVVTEILGILDKEFLEECITTISSMKNSLITPEEAENRVTNQREQTIAYAYRKYQYKLQSNKALDFDDLIMKTVMLLRASDSTRLYCQRRFRFVMGDEIQDTNTAQFELLELIAGRNNIFVVGDDSQSIYGWRGANIDNIIKFQAKYPDSKIIKLEQNYRSTQTIVNTGNAVIRHNIKRLDKTCYSCSEIGEPVKIYKAKNDVAEADFIVKEIINLNVYDAHEYKDIAILCRVNKLTRVIEDQFIRNGIPYQVVNGTSFYQRKEIKDVVAMLRSVINPTEDLAYERMLKVTPKVGDKTIAEIKKIARVDDISLSEAVARYEGRSKAQLISVSRIIETLGGLITHPITFVIEKLFELTGYLKRLQAVNTAENQERIENLEELISIAAEFEKNNETDTLSAFLDRMTLSSDTDADKGDDRVKLMTIHSSKGLEFKTVFIMGVEEGLLPHKRSINEGDIEEERRLLYVAITRAEKNLYISNASARMNYGSVDSCFPSRFLTEIPKSMSIEIW